MIQISSSDELLRSIGEAIPQVEEWLHAPGRRPIRIETELLRLIVSDLKRIEGELLGSSIPLKEQRPNLVGRILRYEGLGSQDIHPLIDLLLAIADFYKYKLPGGSRRLGESF